MKTYFFVPLHTDHIPAMKTAFRTILLLSVLTSGGRIAARRDASGMLTGYDVLHHITDHLGSVRTVVDAATGTVVETGYYLPYGTRWSQTGGSAAQTLSDPDNRWRHSGKEEQKALHQDLPLIDYGAHMYKPLNLWNQTIYLSI